jgi:phosphonoacetaldehyde hydrolase
MTRRFTFSRRYCGPLRAAIFDWAGTTVDFGSMAPVRVLQRVFESQGVPVTTDEARRPMGMHKRQQIAAIAQDPTVARRWRETHGRQASDADIDAMYAAFEPLQAETVAESAQLVPGVLDVVSELRRRGVAIGSTTGYSRAVMDVLQPAAAACGFIPDAVVCASDVPVARPSPFMAFQNLMALQIWPVEACLKVDDTVVGIEEGLNAGMWTVAVALSGNEVGLTAAELATLRAADREALRARAYARLHQAGAHYVIDSIADLLPCVERIDARLADGRRP